MIYNLCKMLNISYKEAGSYTEYEYYEIITFENLQAAKEKWKIDNPEK